MNKLDTRLDYIDICKVVAIYIVTFTHCAQQLSGEKFPNLLISKDSFISINMAIFMIASGFVINIEKMKATSTKDYILSKAYRLLLPMTSWFVVMCIVTFSCHTFATYWSLYWYLGSLFFCLSIIKILLNYISNILLVCILSILLTSFVPMIFFERICYMMPFLWVGYGLRHCIERISNHVIVILIILYCIMYYYWDISYSIYVTPFHFWSADAQSFFSLFFRFTIGSVGGVAFICLLRALLMVPTCSWLKRLAIYGRYTLAFYTMSFILNAILVRILWHINWFISTPGVLDIASLAVSSLMMILMYYAQELLEKNKITRIVFLGMK